MEKTINNYEPMRGPGWEVNFTLPEWVTGTTDEPSQEKGEEVKLYGDWRKNDADTVRDMLDNWARKWKDALDSKPLKPAFYGYVARDKNGALWFFTSKPKRNWIRKRWYVIGDGFRAQMDPKYFPEVEWDGRPKGFVFEFNGTSQT